MLDLKTMKSALEQLEDEKNTEGKDIDAIEAALRPHTRKDYGKKGRSCAPNLILIQEKLFRSVKIVVDDSTVRMPVGEEEEEESSRAINRTTSSYGRK